VKTMKLNGTDRSISAIGIGAMHLSLSGRPDEETALKVLHRALDMDVTLIDTADSYCIDESDKHHNERIVQKALDTWDGDPSQVTVATKGGLMRTNGAWVRNGDPAHIRRTIRESAEILEGDPPIDLWQFHAPDDSYAITESLKPVAEARESGLIRWIGVSNFSLPQLREAREVVDVVSLQNEYSPWHREPEENGLLTYCEDQDITFFPHRPLGGRNRATKLHELDGVGAVAEEHGVSTQRVVLAWHRARSPVIVPIPGVSRVESVNDSVPAADLDLTDAEIARIDQSAA